MAPQYVYICHFCLPLPLPPISTVVRSFFAPPLSPSLPIQTPAIDMVRRLMNRRTKDSALCRVVLRCRYTALCSSVHIPVSWETLESSLMISMTTPSHEYWTQISTLAQRLADGDEALTLAIWLGLAKPVFGQFGL